MKLMDDDKVVGFSLYDRQDKPVSVTASAKIKERLGSMMETGFGRMREQKNKHKKRLEDQIRELELSEPPILEASVTVGLGLDRTVVGVPEDEFDAFIASCRRTQDEVSRRKIEVGKHRDKLRAARKALREAGS